MQYILYWPGVRYILYELILTRDDTLTVSIKSKSQSNLITSQETVDCGCTAKSHQRSHVFFETSLWMLCYVSKLNSRDFSKLMSFRDFRGRKIVLSSRRKGKNFCQLGNWGDSSPLEQKCLVQFLESRRSLISYRNFYVEHPSQACSPDNQVENRTVLIARFIFPYQFHSVTMCQTEAWQEESFVFVRYRFGYDGFPETAHKVPFLLAPSKQNQNLFLKKCTCVESYFLNWNKPW